MKKEAVIFMSGCCIYPTLEVIWRSHTHASMAIAGGLSLLFINQVCCEWLRSKPLLLRCFAGALIITVVELIIGLVVNSALKMDVWDYSSMPLNILGQICLPFTFLWLGLSLPAMSFCDLCAKAELLKDE